MKQTIFKTENNTYIIVNGDIDIFKKRYEELTRDHRGCEGSNYTNFFKKLRIGLKQYGITFTEFAEIYHAFDNTIYTHF